MPGSLVTMSEKLLSSVDDNVSSAYTALDSSPNLNTKWSPDAAADFVFAFYDAASEQWNDLVDSTPHVETIAVQDFIKGLRRRFLALWDERLVMPATAFFEKASELQIREKLSIGTQGFTDLANTLGYTEQFENSNLLQY